MNNQNRTADGKIASKKEAMRSDLWEMVNRYRGEAKAALRNSQPEVAKALVAKCAELRSAFFTDFGEAA